MTIGYAKLKLEWVHTDRATVYKNIDQIFNDHEAIIKDKDKEIDDLQNTQRR